MLDRIESIVTVRGYVFSRLDGSTERSQRQKLVNSFNQDASTFLFLISTLAGGVGLNLTSANKSVPALSHFDILHLWITKAAVQLSSKRAQLGDVFWCPSALNSIIEGVQDRTRLMGI